MARDYKKNNIKNSGIFYKDCDPVRQSELYGSSAYSRMVSLMHGINQSEVSSLEHRLFLDKIQLYMSAQSEPSATAVGHPAAVPPPPEATYGSPYYKKDRDVNIRVWKPGDLSGVIGTSVPGSRLLQYVPVRFAAASNWDSSGSIDTADAYTLILNYGLGGYGEYYHAIPLSPDEPSPFDAETVLMLYVDEGGANPDIFTTAVHHNISIIVEHNTEADKHGTFVEDPVLIDNKKRYTTIRIVCDIASMTVGDLLSALGSVTAGSARTFNDGLFPLHVKIFPEVVPPSTLLTTPLNMTFMKNREEKPYIATIKPRSVRIEIPGASAFPPVFEGRPVSFDDQLPLDDGDVPTYGRHHPFLFSRGDVSGELTSTEINGHPKYDANFINTGTYGFVVAREGVQKSMFDTPTVTSTGNTNFEYLNGSSSSAQFAFIPASLGHAIANMAPGTTELDPTFDPSLKVPVWDIYKPSHKNNPYLYHNTGAPDPGDGTAYMKDTFLPMFTVTEKKITFLDGTVINLDDYLDYFLHTGETSIVMSTGSGGSFFSGGATRLSNVTYDAIEEWGGTPSAPYKDLFPTMLGPVVPQDEATTTIPGKDSLVYIDQMFTALYELINRRSSVYPDSVKRTELLINPETVSAVGFSIEVTDLASDLNNIHVDRWKRISPTTYTLPLIPLLLGTPSPTTPVYVGAILPTGFINIITPNAHGAEPKAYVVTDILGATKRSTYIGNVRDPGVNVGNFRSGGTIIGTNGAITTTNSGEGLPPFTPLPQQAIMRRPLPALESPEHGLVGDQFTGYSSIYSSLNLFLGGSTKRIYGGVNETKIEHTGDTATGYSIHFGDISDTISITHEPQASMHVVLSDLLSNLSMGQATTIAINDKSSGARLGGQAGDLVVDATVNSIYTTAVAGSDGTNGHDQRAFGRYNEASLLRRTVFTSAATNIDTYINVQHVLESLSDYSPPPAHDTLTIDTFTRFRTLLRKTYSTSLVQTYLKRTLNRSLPDAMVDNFTVDVDYYTDLKLSSSARGNCAKNRSVLFSAEYILALVYGISYESLTSTTYGDYITATTTTEKFYPAIESSRAATYTSAPQYDIAHIALFNPSIIATKTDATTDPTSASDTFVFNPIQLNTVPNTDTNPTSEKYRMSTYYREIDSPDSDLGSGSFAQSLGLLSKIKLAGATSTANKTKVFPFAMITLPVYAVSEVSPGVSRKYFNVDAANYIKKVTLIRSTPGVYAAGETRVDITNLYKGTERTVLDLGLTKYVADRDDSLGRNKDIVAYPPLAEAAKDYSATFIRQQYDASVQDSSGEFHVLQLADPTISSVDGTRETTLETMTMNDTLSDLSYYPDVSSPLIITRTATDIVFEDNNVLVSNPDMYTPPVPGKATLHTIAMAVSDSVLRELTFEQIAVDIKLNTPSTATDPLNLDHEIEISPINAFADLSLGISLEIDLVDDLVDVLHDHGLVLGTDPTVLSDDFTAPYSGITRAAIKVGDTAADHTQWSDAGSIPGLSVPITVSIGYLPLYFHDTDADLVPYSTIQDAIMYSADTENKFACTVNSGLLTAQNSDEFASQERTTVRPGKVVITQRMRNVKIYSTVKKGS